MRTQPDILNAGDQFESNTGGTDDVTASAKYGDPIGVNTRSRVTEATVNPGKSNDPFHIEMDSNPILEESKQSRLSPSINVQEYPTCK
jgi:hypothetical protein